MPESDFQTVDLKPVYNANTSNIASGDGYVWPYNGDDPESTAIANLPQGDERFWGRCHQVALRCRTVSRRLRRPRAISSSRQNGTGPRSWKSV